MIAPMKRARTTALLGGFFLGIVLRSSADVGLAFVCFILLLGAALGVWHYVDGRDLSRTSTAVWPRASVLVVALFFVALSLGVLRTHVALARPLDPLLVARLGSEARLTGLIVAEPDERETSTRLAVRFDELIGERGEAIPVRGRALVVVPTFPKFAYGDRVAVEGELAEPRGFEDAVGTYVDYAAYLRKDGIRLEIKHARVELGSSGHGSFIMRWLLALKGAFLERVARLIPEPHASLLGGLLVGERRSLGEDVLEEFRAVGLIHIVVLSGYNISIVADSVKRLFARIASRRAAFLLAAASIVLFALMTGGSATVVRASVMALIALLARSTSRIYDITRALMFAGVAMALHNPLIVVFDPSFQLSFLATLALILVAPIVVERLTFVPERWKLREITAATIATQLFVLPLLLSRSGGLSLVSLPANLLVLIATPATMLFGFLTGSVGLASTLLATPLAWIATALLGYILAVTETLASLPFASISVPPLPLGAVIIAYGCIGAAVAWLRSREQQTTRLVTRRGSSSCF